MKINEAKKRVENQIIKFEKLSTTKNLLVEGVVRSLKKLTSNAKNTNDLLMVMNIIGIVAKLGNGGYINSEEQALLKMYEDVAGSKVML